MNEQKLTPLENELLCEHFSGKDLENAVKRYKSGEPLAYIIGEWYCYGLTFKLNRECLIPRPDTEHIVEKAIDFTPNEGCAADLCTGSGCIAVSLVKNRPDIRALAVDISASALECASINAEKNGIRPLRALPSSGRFLPDEPGMIAFMEADIFPLTLPHNSFDVIISNPPYIKSEVLKNLPAARYEPTAALDGGKDGMRFYRHILQSFRSALKRNGRFIFEIGYDQAEDMRVAAHENGFECEIFRDYGGNDRVALLHPDIQTGRHAETRKVYAR